MTEQQFPEPSVKLIATIQLKLIDQTIIVAIDAFYGNKEHGNVVLSW